MKKILCCLTVLLGLSWAVAQTDSSSSSGSQAGASPSGSADQGTKKAGHKKGAGGATLTGCLSGPNDEGAYVLKSGKRSVEVGGNDELSKHVGHSVKLHGSWAKSGSEIGEKEEKGEAKEGKEEKGERHFKVTSIDHVAESCEGGAAGGEGHPSTPPK